MKRFLLDTGIASDFMNRRHGVDLRVREARIQGARIGTGMPVVCELYFGVEASASREKNLKLLRRALSEIVCWPLNSAAVEEYGRIAATLKRIGRRVQQIDIQIAAIAMSLGDCTVVSKDSDLFAIPALSVENWAVE